MTTRTTPYPSGKFDSAQDEVIHRLSLDSSYVHDEFGDTDAYGLHCAYLLDLFGADWIVATMASGAVEVTRYPRPPHHRSFEGEAHWENIQNDYNIWAVFEDDDECELDGPDRTGDR